MLGLSTSQAYADNSVEDGSNWAVGGYRTDQILSSITDAGGAVTGFRSRDGYLFARDFAADPSALYYVNGGGNNGVEPQPVLEPKSFSIVKVCLRCG